MYTYAAAAKSLQSCPTLCSPIDSSPPGSSVPGVLQARTLEWVAISFSADKESACSVGDLGSVSGLGRSPGEGKGYPLHYSGLENSMGHIDHGKSQTRPSRTVINLRYCFHHREIECKCTKSRDTWSNRQVWPGSM